MELAHTNPREMQHAALAVGLILTVGIMAAVALTMLGIDITPAISWPTTYAPGPGGDGAYLPPAR